MKYLCVLFVLLYSCKIKDTNEHQNLPPVIEYIPLEKNSKEPIHEFKYSSYYKDQLYGRVWKNTNATYELRIATLYEDSASDRFTAVQYLLYDDSSLIVVASGNIYWPSMTKPMDSIKIQRYTVQNKEAVVNDLINVLNFDYKIYQDCLDKYANPADGYMYLEIEELTPKSYKSFVFPEGNVKLCEGEVFDKIEKSVKELEKLLSLDLISPPYWFLEGKNIDSLILID